MAKFKKKTGTPHIILNNGTFTVKDVEYRQYLVKFIGDEKYYKMNKPSGSNVFMNSYTHPSAGREITCLCDGTTIREVRNTKPHPYGIGIGTI